MVALVKMLVAKWWMNFHNCVVAACNILTRLINLTTLYICAEMALLDFV